MNIEHIAVYVKDLEKSALFFETYFGGKRNKLYRNNKTGFSSYFITFDDSTRLELMSIQNLSENSADLHFGYAHIAFKVSSENEVKELTNVLEKDGFKIKSYPRRTGDGYFESSVYDADGNLIEITA